MTIENEADVPDEAELNPAVRVGGYTSPLMSRAANTRLTVEMLQDEIPKVRAGEAAALRMDDSSLSDKERRAARVTYVQGQRAKERLFAAALPLIRTIAQREYRRRQQWGSRVAFDDLMQEAIVGFFKGLAGFKPEAIRKSATNYLGQWMLVEMRRSAEVMDHDLQVGHDAGERFRRVRALRSRLMSDLGREPTDEEISAASRNPAYVVRPGMVGRAPSEGEAPAVGKGLTAAQVAEERTMRDRVGSVVRMTSSDGREDSGGVGAGFVDVERIADDRTDSLSQDPAEAAADGQVGAVLAALVSQVMVRMQLPDAQTEIVARRYGLPPYGEESSARAIARDMGVHRERVARVLTAFADEMTQPGGAFHQVIADLDEDDLVAIGFGWLVDTLGPYDPQLSARRKISNTLTEPLTRQASGAGPAPRAERVTTTADGALGWYWCAACVQEFSSLYQTAEQVPHSRPCPRCGNSAEAFTPESER